MGDRLLGLVAAPFTAFDAQGELDLRAVERQAERLINDGVSGAFVAGTTGEGLSLTTSERLALARRWVEVAGDRLKVIVHVGHHCLKEAEQLAEEAARAGACAVGATGPSFLRPPSIDELAAICERLARAASPVPFYYYHIPALSGIGFRMLDLLERAEGRFALRGVKFTFEDLADFQACVEFAGGRYDMLFGRDEMLLSGLAAGAKGAIGSTYNFAAPVYTRLWEAFDRGDLASARLWQSRAQAMIRVLISGGGLACGKAIMKLVGVDCGPCRLPLRTFDQALTEKLAKDLDAIGFFGWLAKADVECGRDGGVAE